MTTTWLLSSWYKISFVELHLWFGNWIPLYANVGIVDVILGSWLSKNSTLESAIFFTLRILLLCLHISPVWITLLTLLQFRFRLQYSRECCAYIRHFNILLTHFWVMDAFCSSFFACTFHHFMLTLTALNNSWIIQCYWKYTGLSCIYLKSKLWVPFLFKSM